MSLRHSLVKSHPVGLDVMALFWTASEYNERIVDFWYMDDDEAGFGRMDDKSCSHSVRCIKD